MPNFDFIKNLLIPIKTHIKRSWFKAKWRKKNQHNLTQVNTVFPIEKVSVGKATYGVLNVLTYGNTTSALNIGHYCSIAEAVIFILDGGHNYKRCSSYPFPSTTYHLHNDSSSKGPIIVEDDVWIGYGSIILSGVTLGKGCVIGAGSVVSKNVPPYAIYAGNKILKFRFSETIIEQLMKLDYSKITDGFINSYKTLCETEVNENNIDLFRKIIDFKENLQ
jgi:acetyltransferase-like isoleucine patch superfamily enzyme